MENASKALIIAGAILLSILLISLGIMIFNQAQDATKNSGMSQAQVSTFNNKFSKYEGKKIKGSEVNGMIQEVIASNGDENNQNAQRLVSVYYKTAATMIVNSATNNGTNKSNGSKIQSNMTYTVEITEYDKNGYVKTIKIDASNNDTTKNN